MANSAKQFRPGFTIVEIMVVLLVVALALVGILSLITQTIQGQSYNKDNLTASQLAQEGIELIRRVRDSNWKASQPFNTNLAPAVGMVFPYYMDYRDSAPHPHNLSQPGELVLHQDSNGFYFNDINSAATSTPFSRLITVVLLDSKSMEVNCTVTWGDHNRSYSYNLETLLYDWY